MPRADRLTALRGAVTAFRAAATVGVLALVAACAPSPAPPRIALGTPCATCGMEVQDLKFACAARGEKGWHVYDSIECLLRDTTVIGADVYLADYDRATLHRADSLWVVRGAFASPMGGGLAAFLDRDAADSVAAATHGRTGRLVEFRAGAGR